MSVRIVFTLRETWGGDNPQIKSRAVPTVGTLLLAMLVAATPAGADPCVVADNGTGTVTLPPIGCEYLSPDEVHLIIDGLPAGSTIELDPIHMDFFCEMSSGICSLPIPPGQCEMPGGSLGGDGDCFESTLDLTVTGTGDLAGFNRHLAVPVGCEVHTGPRNPGDPVQTFAADMYRLQGELFGDPDFCTFRVLGGTDFGLPSPGTTTLTELPSGDFAVDSFFDITYQIEFEGCPGSMLDGYMGTTTATIRMETEIFQDCEPLADGSACADVLCPDATEVCESVCMNYDPDSGQISVIDCDCRGTDECRAVIPADSDPCIVEDNGTGTITLPPIGCDYISPNEVHEIIEGLPPGTTIELDPIHTDFFCPSTPSALCSMPLLPGECETAGGSLGGNGDCFESTLDLTVTGTGDLTGFNRHIAVPVSCEVHTGPRTPGDPVQTFANDMYRLQGELFGDPDFCTFRVLGGTDFGLPGPGETTLTQLPTGDFAVDSFFDITYQIEFEGCPGSVLTDYSGTTTATLRMRTKLPQPPTCVGDCLPGEVCEETQRVNPDGTIDICCDCAPDVCEPMADGSACKPVACPDTGDVCQPQCLNYDPATGDSTVIVCECEEPGDCHALQTTPPSDPCVVEDNGTGTVTLPPIGCDYLSPDEVHMIIEGLPPGTTIELDPIHTDFICEGSTGLCSLPLSPGECEMAGGTLGGHGDCFASTLDLTVTGTGDLAGFNRHLAVPVSCEVHTGPRTPGDPVQTFANDMYRLQGELFGDPDFCTFRVLGGSDFGLPGAGTTTLTELPSGDFAVDSFFDITYQIEFEGCPDSQLADYMGTTTATIQMRTEVAEPPTCVGDCAADEICEEVQTPAGDGTIDFCCVCVSPPLDEACCLSDGSCVDTPAEDCAGLGGTSRGPGSQCHGDHDGNGIDDACEFIKWDQPLSTELSGLHAHDYAGGQIITADQWVCEGGAVTDIHWWGAYEDPGSGLAGFHLSIHPNLPGEPWCLPDVEIWGEDLTPGQYNEYPTGLVNNLGEAIYLYEYFLDVPFEQIEGETYWLDIMARSVDVNNPVLWKWQEMHRTSPPIICPAAQQVVPPGTWSSATWPGPLYSDMAFMITSAELTEIPDPPEPEPSAAGKNRYISFMPGNAGSQVALRVIHVSSGSQWWVQAHLTGKPADVFQLGATAYYTDWGTEPAVIHVGDCGIAPDQTYIVQALDISGDPGNEADYSAGLTVPTVLEPTPKFWADCVGSFVGSWGPPNGIVNMNDVQATLQRFSGSPSAPPLVWVDVDGQTPNAIVNMTDVQRVVGGFKGDPYPFVAPSACP